MYYVSKFNNYENINLYLIEITLSWFQACRILQTPGEIHVILFLTKRRAVYLAFYLKCFRAFSVRVTDLTGKCKIQA